MNKPPIKPPIKPKPTQLLNQYSNRTDKNSLNLIEVQSKSDLNYDSNISNQSANDLSCSDLKKAYHLLNQKSLSEKDDNHYDVRVDEDQIETCNQIIRLLSEAGYLRANIIGLSEFDKIIGGVCWCIELCNIDIDIDLFYQTTLTIGQKLALTEKIIKVLNIMKCPHQIEAHQIQGLDCINILPVVQWLIKESREFSAHIKDYNDMFAAWKFDCDHGLLNNREQDLLVISRSKEVKKIIKEYFNKNEIKINLEYKIDQFEKELENAEKIDQQLDEEFVQLDNIIRLKEQEIEKIVNECTELTKQLVEHQSDEKKS